MKSKNIQLLLQNQVWDDKTDRPMYNDNVFSFTAYSELSEERMMDMSLVELEQLSIEFKGLEKKIKELRDSL